jgi:hypothetical protein
MTTGLRPASPRSWAIRRKPTVSGCNYHRAAAELRTLEVLFLLQWGSHAAFIASLPGRMTARATYPAIRRALQLVAGIRTWQAGLS